MRTIKYKAWHKPTKKLFDVYSVSNEFVYDNSIVGEFSMPIHPAKREDCILMESLGIFDKNGKEFFNGSIFTYTQHEGYILPSFVGKVKYDQDLACYGYSVINGNGLFTPFANHDELKTDVLDHCEIIDENIENELFK